MLCVKRDFFVQRNFQYFWLIIFSVTVKAPAKRVQHFIQHHTTLMFYEMLHSFGHLVLPCFIVLYLVVWSLIAIKLFTKQMLYDTTFLLFSAMLYDVVLVWQPHATLLYSVVLARVQQKYFFRHIPLLNLFLKTCLIVLYEMLHLFGHPSVKHD